MELRRIAERLRYLAAGVDPKELDHELHALARACESATKEILDRLRTPEDAPVIKYAFAGDNGPGTKVEDWSRHIFDTEEKARGFGGEWKGRIVTVEIRPLEEKRVKGTVDFNPPFDE